MSYKGKTPYQYDRSSRRFHQGAWKHWPDHRPFADALKAADERALARRPRGHQFTENAPRFKFNGKGETKFLRDHS